MTSSATRAREVWLDEVLRLLTRHVFDNKADLTSTATRLSEVFFIELIRLGVGQTPRMDSILAAFTDKHIGRALELMHSVFGRHQGSH